MYRIAIAAIAAVVACSVSGAGTATAKDGRAIRAKLQRQMVDHARDPASVQVRGAFLSASEGDGAVVALCGEVNAKNAYGGYVGFGRFISTSEGQVIFQSSEPDGAFGHIWPVWCSRPLR